MARGRLPTVNASLLHEVRMIAQQFFGGRQDNYYSMRIAQTQATKPPVCNHPVLKCSFCFGTALADAVFVINGYSTCVVHEGKARSATNTPKFS